MDKRIVLVTTEDGYTLCAVMVPQHQTTDEFLVTVEEARERTLDSEEMYEDNRLMEVLEDMGYELANIPESIEI